MRARHLALLLLPLAACGPDLPVVESATAQRDPLVVSVSTNGSVEPVDARDLRARLDGRVVEIAEPGAVVAAGGTLVRIDDAPVVSALREAEAGRVAAQGELRAAREELARAEKRAETDRQLFEARALTAERFEESRSERDAARTRVRTLEREVPERVAALELRIRTLEEQRESAHGVAPFAGTVYQREVRAGEFVRAGDLLLRFADLEHLRVRTNVDQVDLGRVRAGQGVRISSNAFPGRHWSGRMTEVVPNVVIKEARSVSESLAAVEPPAEGLVPGMNVDVEIRVDEASDALQVPTDAVFLAGGRHYVQRIDGDRVRRTPVRVGRSSVGTIEIVEGLEAGDRVVVGALDGLPDGTRVEANERDVAAEPHPEPGSGSSD